MNYGTFAGSVVDFLIIAFVVYVITKALIKEAPSAAPSKTCPRCKEAVAVDASGANSARRISSRLWRSSQRSTSGGVVSLELARPGRCPTWATEEIRRCWTSAGSPRNTATAR